MKGIANKTGIAAAVAAALALGSGAAAQNIGGLYTVKGTSFDGSSYTGTALITQTGTTTCRIARHIGEASSTGICIRNNGSLAASYTLGDKIGLVIYQLRPDGSMSGFWTTADQTGGGTETLLPR